MDDDYLQKIWQEAEPRVPKPEPGENHWTFIPRCHAELRGIGIRSQLAGRLCDLRWEKHEESKTLHRLGECIGEIWGEYVDTPLAELRFGTPEEGALATVQYVRDLGGMRMVIGKRADMSEMLWLGLHETAHAFLGDDGPELESRCDRLADNWRSFWKAPVLAYVERGDAAPMRSLLKTLAWAKQEAERKADDDARRFAEICRAHGVVSLEQAPNRCSPAIKFANLATKAVDYEIEAWIRERGITDPAMVKFVRSVLTRRKRFMAWLADLGKAGLVAEPA